MEHNLAKELDHHKQTIKQLVTADLVAAYYYQRGAIANSLQFDKQWKEAVRLLGNIDEYKKILTPAPNKK